MLISVVDLLTLLILILAVARVTRLIVWDKITLPLRKKIVAWNGATGLITYLVHCIYCTGFWVTAAMTGLLLALPHNKILLGIYAALAVAEAAPRFLAYEPRTGGQ